MYLNTVFKYKVFKYKVFKYKVFKYKVFKYCPSLSGVCTLERPQLSTFISLSVLKWTPALTERNNCSFPARLREFY